MSKILAISDIHIFDYPQRNSYDKQRLTQARTVAQNIIKAATIEGAERVVIAGDVIEKSVLRPYVQAEVKLFLDTLMSFFKEGYIIWGNHDQDNKSVDSELIDSCLAVMLPPNLYYADQKELVIDNSRIAFSNWRPEFDLSWISGQVDVLFTHATINYGGSDKIQSQVLDESKFGLAICGDIHRPAQIGKYVSIGIPQKCKMSDYDKSTGVVYDCVSKQFKWVDLNPDDNLMKFVYTPIREDEGWNQGTGTWSVYKPENLSIAGGVRDIKIPAWEEIGNLIDNIIIENNLQGIHSEVLRNLKDVDSEEVDFGFTLLRLYCKNWRSIDEADIYFEDGDKILITGKNGSGKSSLLSALKYAFLECRNIKDYLQFGEKECILAVEFMYQGKKCKIQRGNKKYGCWIDDEPLKYNNKKEFEEDMYRRFPFIGYMDIFLFDSDHHKLIGNITPERKSEIISKFYKMDRIDAYNKEAGILLDQVTKSSSVWNEAIKKSEEILRYIDTNLSNIQLPGQTKTELTQLRSEGLELQRKNKEWMSYLADSGKLQAQVSLYVETLERLIKEQSTYRHLQEIDSEIAYLQAEVDNKNQEISQLRTIESEYSLKLDRYNQVCAEGKKTTAELERLEKSKVCPSCGQALKNTESLDRHKQEILGKLEELRSEAIKIGDELRGMSGKKQQADSLISIASEKVKTLGNQIFMLMSEKQKITKTAKDIENTKSLLENYKTQLNNLGTPEKVELPDNFMEIMSSIDSGIKAWTDHERLIQDRAVEEANILKAQSELGLIQNALVDLKEYIKLTGPTGKIYEEIMTRLAEQFTDNQVKYSVDTYNFRKKDHLDLTSRFNNNGNYVSYDACSSGQQTVLDINFLSKIVTRMGLLIMDEFLKHLDPENHDNCIDMISSMNIGCIMISSHMESITSFNNKTCRLELNDSGVTNITIK